MPGRAGRDGYKIAVRLVGAVPEWSKGSILSKLRWNARTGRDGYKTAVRTGRGGPRIKQETEAYLCNGSGMPRRLQNCSKIIVRLVGKQEREAYL